MNRPRRNPRTLVAALCLSAAGGFPPGTAIAQSGDDFPARAALFAYDARAPLQVREVGREVREGGVLVRDLTFSAVPGRDPARAYVVEPPGERPCAGVLWVHWLGEPETTNRTQFLAEAVRLAPRGLVSVLVDAMWSAPGWYDQRVPEEDFQNSLRQVIALRRALDLLAARPRVDRARLGLVGHDYGGMYGMIAAGVDPRARAYVFLATAPSLSAWAFFARQPASKAAYLRQNAVLELTDYVRRIKNASTLLQFARNDAYVSRADTAVLLAAFDEPRERRFYEADHAMSAPGIAEDRAAFLADRLALEPR